MADKKRVLVVEDDMFLRELCMVKLEKSGYQVDAAPDGKTGVDYLTSREYDVVLLDIMLPEKDGFQVLEEYSKAEKKDKQPQIIMLTNLSEKEQVDKALKLGATDYIIKAHYSPTEIVTKVNELLGQ